MKKEIKSVLKKLAGEALYFQIGEDIEMIIMQVRPSVARQEELLFEFKINEQSEDRLD